MRKPSFGLPAQLPQEGDAESWLSPQSHLKACIQSSRVCSAAGGKRHLLRSPNTSIATFPPRSLRASGSSRSPRQAEGLAGKAGQEQAGLLQAAPRATPGAGTLPPLPQLLASLMLIIKKPLYVSGKRDSERGTKPPAAVCLQTTQLSCEEGLKAVIVFN